MLIVLFCAKVRLDHPVLHESATGLPCSAQKCDWVQHTLLPPTITQYTTQPLNKVLARDEVRFFATKHGVIPGLDKFKFGIFFCHAGASWQSHGNASRA